MIGVLIRTQESQAGTRGTTTNLFGGTIANATCRTMRGEKIPLRPAGEFRTTLKQDVYGSIATDSAGGGVVR